jgi:toxin CcdB
MGQFAVHRNTSPETKSALPYLLDVQSSLISELGTRVVVPLCPARAMKGGVITTLMPTLEIDGKAFVMMTPQMAGVPKRILGPVVADMNPMRDEIMAAIDFLLLGF